MLRNIRQEATGAVCYGAAQCAAYENTTTRMPAECVLVQGPLEPEDVPRVAAIVDCIVNSANNHLLTPGVSGIAGALLAVGGPELQAASDAAKQAAGGEVAIGSAVATPGGQLPCGVVHAVGMGYEPSAGGQYRRVLATADSVEQSLRTALLVAAERGWRSAACKIMCCRPGYSIYDEDAPRTMLAAMRRAVSSLPPDCIFEQLVVYIPAETLELFGEPPACLEPKPLADPHVAGAVVPVPVPEPEPAPSNETVVCVGDLHGHIDKALKVWVGLEAELGEAGLAAATVIFLGDYVDRGPNTKEVLNWLIWLEETRAPGTTHFLAGNHDFAFGCFLGCLEVNPSGFDLDGTKDPRYTSGYWAPEVEGGMHYQGRRWGGDGVSVRKYASFGPFPYKTDHFAKTDSGQPQGKLKQRSSFAAGYLRCKKYVRLLRRRVQTRGYGAETASFEPFYTINNDQFTKTGSGQT